MENKVICSLPFEQIYNHLGREYAPCCWAKNISKNNPHNILPLDHFDGEEFRRIRKEMIIGEKTEFLNSWCKVCYESESQTNSSPRLEYPIKKSILNNFNLDGSLKDNDNRFITIAINVFGNYCNLECYGCNPHNSTARNSALKKLDEKWNKIPEMEIRRYSLNEPDNYLFTLDNDIKKVNKNQFDKIINQLVEYSHKILRIQIVGGEAALMKSHFELLDRLIECGQSQNIRLSYVSNMTAFNLNLMEYYFTKFKFTQVQWSVDALKDRNYWLRYPTDWDATIKNVFDIQKYFKNKNLGTITATITPSLLSITSLPKTYKWLFVRRLIFSNNYIFNSVKEPKMLRTRNLPNELKEEIASSVKIVSEFHYNDLMQPRNEEEFQLAIQYFDELDRSRGTDWRSTFPEVAKYAN